MARILKDCCDSRIQDPEVNPIAKFGEKQKFQILGQKMTCWAFLTQNALFGYFRAKTWKTPIAISKISTFKFVQMKNVAKLGLTIPYLGYFSGRLLKKDCHM